jgi:hypothetical protein
MKKKMNLLRLAIIQTKKTNRWMEVILIQITLALLSLNKKSIKTTQILKIK